MALPFLMCLRQGHSTTVGAVGGTTEGTEGGMIPGELVVKSR